MTENPFRTPKNLVESKRPEDEFSIVSYLKLVRFVIFPAIWLGSLIAAFFSMTTNSWLGLIFGGGFAVAFAMSIPLILLALGQAKVGDDNRTEK